MHTLFKCYNHKILLKILYSSQNMETYDFLNVHDLYPDLETAQTVSTKFAKKYVFRFQGWGGLGDHCCFQNRSRISKKSTWMTLCTPIVLQRGAGAAQELQNGALSIETTATTCNKSVRNVRDFYITLCMPLCPAPQESINKC